MCSNGEEGTRQFSPGTFDAVIGNPPYVKLQNFVHVHPDIADWLTKASPYFRREPATSISTCPSSRRASRF